MSTVRNYLDNPIEYLKGVGPVKGQLLQSELGIYTFGDLLMHFPYRYVDKTQFHRIRDIDGQSDAVQLRGILRSLNETGQGRGRRLVGVFRDESGMIELVWFKGVHFLKKTLAVGGEYILYGKVNNFRGKISIPHPEMERYDPVKAQQASTFAPVYASTEKLNNKGLDAKGRRKIISVLFSKLRAEHLRENLPEYLRSKFHFPSHFDALRSIHFPTDQQSLEAARKRLKFEELFFLQIRLLQIRRRRKSAIKGYVFGQIGDYFHRFFKEKLPFELTGAQKRVIKEIRRDLSTGVQMNRLLQGDVGSGKTIVGLMCMLIALDNGYQACLMAPTEILAQQHYQSISEYAVGLDIRVAFLSGSVKGKKRQTILAELAAGHVEHFRGVVDDLVGRDEAERPAHELDDGAQAVHRGTDREPGEAVLGDGRVDDALLAELVQHALADLVRAVVLRDFLAHEEDALVAAHLLGERLAQRFAELDQPVALTRRQRLGKVRLLAGEVGHGVLGIGGEGGHGGVSCVRRRRVCCAL